MSPSNGAAGRQANSAKARARRSAACAMAADGYSDRAISIEIGVSIQTVRKYRHDAGIDRNAERLDAARDEDNVLPCAGGCGRPRHYRPAIACPSIGLPACEVTR